MAVEDCTDYESMGLDPYTVVRVLGSGPDGVTQLVKLGENSALYVRKIIVAEFANVDAWWALARVSHPLVPHVYEQCWRSGAYEVVYDYVPGESLAELVERNTLLNERYAASILLDVADAAGALHAAGIVHRDISPGNVVIDLAGRAHLTDLGIARLAKVEGTRDTTRLGTWGFAAPEQYGFAQTDARSDVYSMGCLLTYACTGVMPEVGATSDELLAALTPELAAVIRKACAFEPSARYQSAAEFANALVACMGSMPVAVVEVCEPEKDPDSESTEDVPPERGPVWLRLLGRIAIVGFAFLGFLAVLAVPTNLNNPDTSQEPHYRVLSALLSIALGAACAYCVVQTHRALKMRGKYARREGRVKTLLLEYLKAVAAWAVFLLVLVFVGAGITAATGGS